MGSRIRLGSMPDFDGAASSGSTCSTPHAGGARQPDTDRVRWRAISRLTITGHVVFRVTGIAGPNGVVSGLFVGAGAGGGSSGFATFVGANTTTQGSWHGVRRRWRRAGNRRQHAAGVRAVDCDWGPRGWAASTGDVRALQCPVGSVLRGPGNGSARPRSDSDGWHPGRVGHRRLTAGADGSGAAPAPRPAGAVSIADQRSRRGNIRPAIAGHVVMERRRQRGRQRAVRW
jgi:hypothetical protein